MIHFIQYANNIIIYLLVGCLFQLQFSNGQSDSAANTVIDNTNNAITDTSNAINKIEGDTRENLSDVLKTTASTAMDFGSQATMSVEDVLKAGGRATVAFGTLCNALFSSVSATLATGGDYLSSGVNSVDSYLENVPVVRTVSGGLNHFLSGLTSTISEVSNNGRQSRMQMFQKLRNTLDKSPSAATDTSASTTSQENPEVSS